MDSLTAPPITPEALSHLKPLVLNSVDSRESKRVYARAIDKFLEWSRGENTFPGLNRAAVQSFKAHLLELKLSSSTVNAYLIPIRRLAAEAADTGLIPSEIASGIGRIRGVRQRGL